MLNRLNIYDSDFANIIQAIIEDVGKVLSRIMSTHGTSLFKQTGTVNSFSGRHNHYLVQGMYSAFFFGMCGI